MKGPLACMLAALLALRTRDDWRGRVTVGWVVDEETEYRGILKLIEDQAPWDYAVVGEPTNLRVVRGCKGSVRLHVRVRGRAAHSSDPSQGRNAIVGMAPVLEAMQAFFDEEIGRYTCPGFTPATGSVGVIEGGSAPNIVPDECAVTLDIRTVPGQDNQETLTDLEAYVRERVPERDGSSSSPPCAPSCLGRAMRARLGGGGHPSLALPSLRCFNLSRHPLFQCAEIHGRPGRASACPCDRASLPLGLGPVLKGCPWLP